jgi:hypothetical protein
MNDFNEIIDGINDVLFWVLLWLLLWNAYILIWGCTR